MRSGPNINQRRRWAFRLGWMGAVALILVGLESGLHVFTPRFLGSVDEIKLNPLGLPYFEVEEKDGYSVYRPSRYYRPWGHRFRFVMPKPKRTFRIFSLGGSTAQGYPFFNPGAFSKWLSVMLSGIADQNYEVINSGQQGFPISEAMSLEKQVLKADPDLIIVCSGNNEFFYHRVQSDDAVSLPAWMLKLKYWLQERYLTRLDQYFLNKVSIHRPDYELEPESMRAHAAYFVENEMGNTWDREHKDQVLSQYRTHLESMVAMAREQGVGIILCTVAVNLKDYEPYGSYHGRDLSEPEKKEWDRMVEAGQDAFARGDLVLARAYFMKAAALDPVPAELNFYLGHCLLRLGEQKKAYKYFQAAMDHDPVRDRTGSDINAIVREVAKSYGVPLADVVPQFRQRAEHGVPGDDLFLDAAHPTLEGHRIIAETILQCMVEEKWVRPKPGWRETAIGAADAYEKKMPSQYLFSSYYTAASLNAFLGRFARARLWVNQALYHAPNHPQGLELKYALDAILKEQSTPPSLPWGEVEFARSYDNLDP